MEFFPYNYHEGWNETDNSNMFVQARIFSVYKYFMHSSRNEVIR